MAAAGRKERVQIARDTLESSRDAAQKLASRANEGELQRLLERAARVLRGRIEALDPRMAEDTFTAVQMRATLRQVELVLKQLTRGMHGVLLDAAAYSAQSAATHTLEYLAEAERAFRGVGSQPLALNEARKLNAAASGASASLLRRIASGPALDHPAHRHHHRHHRRARMGVLQRYGVETIGHFEKTLQAGLVAGKSWAEMRSDIIEDSPFLQGAPKHWATRIVRTEVMGAYNRGGAESIKEANSQFGDVVKILSGVFDDRTAADSYATHGQIRLPGEDFDTWYGPIEHPPDRPNDRAVVTPHRIVWPLPAYLKWRTDEEVQDRWHWEGRKGAPPERPLMTTVPLTEFGK